MQTNIFYNSEVLFIEYRDIIKSPEIILLQIIRNNDKLAEILDFSPITNLSEIGLYEWYINRKNKNVLKELCMRSDISDDDLDELLHQQLMVDDRLYTLAYPLSFTTSINMILKQKIVNKVIFYTEYECPFIKSDISDIVDGSNFEVVSGDFSKAIKDIPVDTTYILSDIDKIETIQEVKGIAFSTIIVPQEYRYNKINMIDYKVNFEELNKDNIFKYGFMKVL